MFTFSVSKASKGLFVDVYIGMLCKWRKADWASGNKKGSKSAHTCEKHGSLITLDIVATFCRLIGGSQGC